MKYNHPEIAALLRKHGAKTGEELKAAGNCTNPLHHLNAAGLLFHTVHNPVARRRM